MPQIDIPRDRQLGRRASRAVVALMTVENVNVKLLFPRYRLVETESAARISSEMPQVSLARSSYQYYCTNEYSECHDGVINRVMLLTELKCSIEKPGR